MSNIKKLEYQVINNENKKEHLQIRITDNKSDQMYLIHKALKHQLTNNRIRKANTKTKSEVRGGGKKPWKQKGTGRARAGSNNSPLWRGGGVIFGPKTKTYHSKINKKEKRLAINNLIFNKFQQTIIVDNLLEKINTPNTKKAIEILTKAGIKLNNSKKVLINVDKQDENIYLSFRNIKNVEVVEISNINIISLLKADTILITSKALNKLQNLT
uniref:Large ribosomal subunit protein uL4c n=1 Tax=Melanothamnus harveyi TaxID=397005 RepID=A0A1Z1MH10_MELHR|nr:ribosomal protein L4 [Melanothamnus harveyi]ARW65358.1 ribosomal protein L4 [Melanothamnus harveyi]